ncbi:sugar phosphate isomerase/epimerase [Candidatus Bipolaricaulota bacterium]|nr:sugar phosphate isomerase/epimerase [Candidatus Bipolaricaulota bacterium]
MPKVGFSLNKPGWCSFQDPAPFLDFLASVGIGAVELPLAVSGEFDQGVAEAALARGLVITFHLVWKREAVWKWYRGWGKRTGRADLEELLATLDELAGRQGAPVLVVIHPFDDGHDRERGLAITADLCRGLIERTRAQRCKVRWAIENMPHDPEAPSRPGDRLRELEELVRETPGLGICWDIGHWHLTRETDPHWSGPLTDRFVGRVIHTHVHDWAPGLGDHLPPGQGTVPFARALRTLRQADYRGWLILELDRERTLCFGPPQEVIRDALAVIRRAWIEEAEEGCALSQ